MGRGRRKGEGAEGGEGGGGGGGAENDCFHSQLLVCFLHLVCVSRANAVIFFFPSDSLLGFQKKKKNEQHETI